MSDIPQTGRARTEPGHHERRLTDPHFLVHADPAEVLALLDSARGPEEQLAAAVYRASAHLHRHSGAARRQLLALDAARFGDRGLSERITAVLLEGEPGGSAARWYVDWATGAPDHRFRHRLSRHALWVGAVATAVVDGRAVAVTGGMEGTVLVWDLATGEQLGEPLVCHIGDGVTALATAVVDGRAVAVTGGMEGTVLVWDLATGEQLGEPLVRHDGDGVTALATAVVDGRAVAVTGGEDGTVLVRDLATGAPIGEFSPGRAPVLAMATAESDGRVVVAVGCSSWIEVWDLAAQERVGRWRSGADCGAVHAVATVTVDGRAVVITGTDDGQARVWDLATGEQLGEPFGGHRDRVCAVATAVVDGRAVAVTGSDGQARMWDLATREQMGEPIPVDRGWKWALATAEVNGRAVVVTGGDGTARAWDLAAPQIGRPRRDRPEVGAVATAEVGGRTVVVTGCEGGTVGMWDLATGEQVAGPVGGHAGTDVLAMAIAVVDGRPLAVVGTDDELARVWDLATREQLGEPFRGHDHGVLAVATAELDGRTVAVTGTIAIPYLCDGALRVWDPTTGEAERQPLSCDGEGVVRVATATVEGRAVAVTLGGKGTVRVWDLAAGDQLGAPLAGPDDRAYWVATAVVDGRPLALTGHDEVLRVWDLATGVPLGDPLAGGGATTGVVDGRAVVVVHERDGARQIRDLATFEPVGPPLVLPRPLRAMAVTPDGRLILAFGQEVAVLRCRRRWPATRSGTGSARCVRPE